ncbi:MAG: MFS transporter [Alphaproteobacteria bacterium]|nr:MFS transporter [Alphaproteobacteria bacterium]
MAFAVLLAVTAVAMLGPLLVDMASAMDTTVPVAGQLVTTAAAAWAVTALMVGPFSDAYGRKPVLLLGTCFLAAGSLGMGLAPSFAVATGFSVLVGIGGGMVPPTCIALIGDIFPEARRPMSIAIITMQPGMSSVLGVPLAAVLGDFAGWRTPFLVLGMALLLATLILFVLVPYHRPPSTRLNLAGRLRQVATFPVTWYMAGTNILARTTWGVVVTFFPAFLIVTYGLKTMEVALPVAMVAVGATAASLLGGRIGRSAKRLSATAVLLLAAAVPGLGVFLLDGGQWFSVSLAGIFMLLIVPVTTVLMILLAEAGGASRGGPGRRHILQQLGRHRCGRGNRRRAGGPDRLWRPIVPAGRRHPGERPAHGIRSE